MKTMEIKKRVEPQTALVILITVAALFAATAIVLGSVVHVGHPLISVFCGVCALLMLARFLYAALREWGRAQLLHMGAGLALSVAFTVFALWSGGIPVTVMLVLLPLGACLSVLTVGVGGDRYRSFRTLIAVATGIALAELLTGITGALPFYPPDPFFSAVYIVVASSVGGGLFLTKKYTSQVLPHAAVRLGATLLSVGCVLFGGYFDPFWSTLLPCALLLGVIGLLFWERGWYKRVLPYCVAVPAFAAAVLNAGWMTGFFANVTIAFPDPLLAKGYGVLAAVTLMLAAYKAVKGRAPAKIAYFSQLALIALFLLFGGHIALPGGIYAFGGVTLVCLFSALFAFASARGNRVLWALVLPAAAIVHLYFCKRYGLVILALAPHFFVIIYALTMVLILTHTVRLTRRINAWWADAGIILLCDACLIAGAYGILTSAHAFILPFVAILTALIVASLWERTRYNRVLLWNGTILGFSAMALNAAMMVGMLVPKAPDGALRIAAVVGAAALLLTAWPNSIGNRYRHVSGAVATRSILSSLTCVVLALIALFGGAMDAVALWIVCIVLAVVALVLLIWRGTMLPLNLFVLAIIAVMMEAVEKAEVRIGPGASLLTTSISRDVFLLCIVLPLIPAIPGAVILTLRRCGNIYKCRKALHGFLCAVGSLLCVVALLLSEQYSRSVGGVIFAAAVAIVIFAVYAVFEKRRVKDIYANEV